MHPSPQVSPEMHVCPSCSSDLVQPVQWRELRRGAWDVELRCPDCEWRSHGEFSQQAVDCFDEALDQGAQQVITDLRRLTKLNMGEEADRLAEALACNALLPEDF